MITSVISERRLIIPGTLDRVPEVCEFVVEAATAAGLDDRALYHCQMAVDEWCTNIVEHGFGHGKRGRIEVVCAQRGTQFYITINDDSPAFNPTTLSEVDPSKPLEEREPGGLGWFFIRKVMDQVKYEFKEGRNYLTMIKNGAQLVHKPLVDEPYPVHDVNGGVRIVSLNGRLDSNNSRTLESALTSQLATGYLRLVLDMSEVTYVSSSGLKVILTAQRQAMKENGNLALAGLSSRVFEIFQISGFDTLFHITETTDEAVSKLASN
jgi:anti-anti-sigma factor